jgi:hypothetical protein
MQEKTLPNEIWAKVFELRNSSASRKEMCALATVRKSWKVRRAMTTLLPSLTFIIGNRRADSLPRNPHHRQDPAHGGGRVAQAVPSFGGWVRRIYFALSTEEDMEEPLSSNLILLLLRMPHLRSFEMLARPVQAAHLECLKVSATGLTELKIIVKGQPVLNLSVISQLRSLRTLKIECKKLHRWSIGSVRPLHLPALAHFTWCWAQTCTNHEVALFLSQCVFARTCIFELVIPHLAGPDAAPLKNWLLAYQPVSIGICMSQEAMLVMSAPLSRTTHVGFTMVLPSASVFGTHTWPSSVSILPGLAQIDALPAFLGGVISLLSDVATRASVTPSLKSIQLLGVYNETRFSWSPPDHRGVDHFSGLRGTLTRCAVELNRYQIKLVDYEMRDLKSYFE